MTGTTLGALLRATQAYCLQLSEAEALDWGVAFTSPRFARLPEANQLREFAVPQEADVPGAFAAVEAFYAARGLVCYRWTPAAGQPYEVVGQVLWEKGYRRRDLRAYALGSWPNRASRPDLRVLPARPLREQFAQTFLDSQAPGTPEDRALAAEAGLARLDHAGYTAYVALRHGHPVGRGALFQVGDIGRVSALYVLPAHRRQGVGSALLSQVLGVARQYMTRTICLELPADDEPALHCVERMGFVADGAFVEFHHPDAPLGNGTSL